MIATRAQIEHWSQGMVKAVIQGGALSLKAFLATAGANAAGLPVQTMDLKGAGAVFVFGAATHLVEFLSSNPVPDEDDDPAAPDGAVALPKAAPAVEWPKA